MTDIIKSDDAELLGLAELKKRDTEARAQYSDKNIVKDEQVEIQVSADRWKYSRMTKYKNGMTKNKCVGVSKINADGKKVLIKNRGVDLKKFFGKKKDK